MSNRDLVGIMMPNGSFLLEWVDSSKKINKSRTLLQKEIYKRFDTGTDAWLLFLGFSDPKVDLSESVDFWRGFAGLFAAKLTGTPELENLRQNVSLSISPDEIRQYLEQAPMMAGSDYLNEDFLADVWARLNMEFQTAIEVYDGSVADFIKSYSPRVHLVGRIFFHLVENSKSDYPFAFLATYSTRLNQQGKSKHLPLKFALREYADHKNKLLELLSTVHLAAKNSSIIADLIESGEIFHPLAWSAKEAFLFLKDIPVFEKAGILCRIPNWWKKSRSSVSLEIKFGDKKPSFVGMDAILNFNAHLFLGDTPLSVAEVRRLLEESEGLAFIKNKWVAVDPKKLEETLAAYENAKKMMAGQDIQLRDALRFQLNPQKLLNITEDNANVEISHGKWLKSVVNKLKVPDLISSVDTGKGFKGNLRKYQQQGLNWLFFLHSLGFGACLADDMGLGKTVQVLAFLNRLKFASRQGRAISAASLLVIPASLISNWEKEIKTFTPELNFFIAHPGANPTRNIETEYKNRINEYDLVITTYALTKRYKWLQTNKWYYLILDEAQAIKNPGAKQTKTLKDFKAQNRIIMTGTPVENRLSDLWSLFDFVNPGLLGNANEFKKFSKRLQKDHSGYARLRTLINPYILRRLKTDKTIISDLPDKVEMKTYAGLSKKQVFLYKQMVDEIKIKIAENNGIARKGIILSSLMKFKQLCNHPDQYLGTGGYDEKESGKFERLREICEIIYEKREKVLVFTQFKEMTEPLCLFMESIFKRQGLLIHGSIPVAKRKKIINDFQQEKYVPFMVLSLKVGGVGLNLTEANHVIHFDRWWNPAVENQATDRAFRIGQQKNVIVHKFITRGTVEEKIDMMLEEKKKLSNDIITSTSEAWITEMDDKKLVDLFSLSL